jgi:hypothetical protein
MSVVSTVPPTGINLYITNKYKEVSADGQMVFKIPTLPVNYTSTNDYQLIVKQVFIRNFINTISKDKNDKIIYQIDDNPIVTIFIEEGVYNVDSLVTTLQTIFTPQGILFSYNSNSKKIVVNTGIHVFRFISETLFTQNNYLRTSSEGKFLEMLGFARQANYPLQGIFEGLDPLNIYGTSYLSVNINSSVNVLTPGTRNLQCIASIPVVEKYGDLIFFEPKIPFSFRLNLNDFQHMTLSVTDEWEDVVVTPPGSFFMIHLLLVPALY